MSAWARPTSTRPTAAASGSTVAYQTRMPFEHFGLRLEGSYGWFDGGQYFRTFGVLDTGEFGPFGTRAFALGIDGDQRQCLWPPRRHLQAAV